VTRETNTLDRHSPQISSLKYFLFYFLGAVLLCAAGCKRKSVPISTAAIRGITREFVFAARNASNGRAEVGMRPEYAARQPGKAPSLVVDHIYVTVPLTKAGAPGLERFDYLAKGRRMQSIHLITPLGSAGTAVSLTSHKPRLAIVIDDLGSDPVQADAIFRLSYRLTLSVLPHHSNSTEIAEEAHRRGYQVMLHLPMASNAGSLDEAIELHPGMDLNAVEKTFDAMLETVPYAAGVNNHEGSLGTADEKLMDELMPLLHQDKLFFIDSRTTAATVAESAAHAAGVRAASRNVFLDDDQSAGAIRKQFALAIHDARKQGSALAIGHPHPETLQILAEMLPETKRQGVTLVFASDLAR
jgi:polysaccharide deacetylase 2 family uncharacterized protein YibQ